MEHGGIGSIERNVIKLPLGVLEPLSIEHNARLYGVYYPPNIPEYRDQNQVFRYRHDFLLTPIPDRYWPRVARFVVRLKHVEGAMAKVTAFLKNEDTNILMAECNRSGHRFATWSITVGFDDLNNENLTYNKDRSVYYQTEQKMIIVAAKMLAKCHDVLFVDYKDFYLSQPIKVEPLCDLYYFHYQSVKRQGEDSFLFNTFSLKNYYGSLREDEDRGNLFSQILDHIEDNEGQEIFPTFIISVLNTNNINIRAAIIPLSRQKKFSYLKLFYRRSTTPDNTSGLLYMLSNHLQSKYNMWRVYNYTHDNEVNFETGSIHLILEDITEEEDAKVLKSNLHSYIEGFIDYINSTREENPMKRVNITDHMIISGNKIHELRNKEIVEEIPMQTDVFISYSRNDEDLKNQLISDLDEYELSYWIDKDEKEDRIRIGDPYADAIKNGLKQSRYYCLIYTKNTDSSSWVKHELSAAWGLDKPLHILRAADTGIEDLPPIIRHLQSETFENRGKYLKQIRDEIDGC